MDLTLILLIALLPPVFFLLHSLVGLLLTIPYGCKSWKLTTRGLHIVASRRIWFGPSAQTHGGVIFFQHDGAQDYEPLVRHEFTHVQQCLLFGAIYPATYILSFAFFYLIVKLKLDWWERNSYDDDVWHAYRMIPWERWAYHVQKNVR